MFGKRIELFRLFGFPIRVDLSWFIVAVLFTWTFAGYFGGPEENWPSAVAWSMGAAAAVGLFGSIVLHELSHAVVARYYGLPIKGITLFIFGGVAEMAEEPPTAKAEFMVAIAGPVASALISGTLGFLWFLGQISGTAAAASAVAATLALLNLSLVLFNLVPAFPLDGGRVLRSILWAVKGDLRWATRVSSTIGSGFGMALILLGILQFIKGDAVGGIWFFLIGLFLRGAAQGSYQQLLLRRTLEGEPVSRFMQTEVVAVPRAISIAELVESYVYRHHFKLFPVVDGDRLVGAISTRTVKELPREEWDRQSVGAVAEPPSEENSIAADADALSALSRMSRTGTSRLLVVDGDRLVGIVALKDLMRFFSLKMELEPEGGRGPSPKADPD